jgi:hypothetical protein
MDGVRILNDYCGDPKNIELARSGTPMFRRQTLFVIGAGASNEFDIPVGKDLATNISRKMDLRREDGDTSLYEHMKQSQDPKDNDKWQYAAFKIRDALPLCRSIDDFLDIHRSDEFKIAYGKAAIVKTILEAENKSSLYFNPQSHQTIAFNDNAETWLVKFMAVLSQERRDVEKIFENVAFIVFNYDRCLEHFLVHALQVQYGLPRLTQRS